MRYTKDISNRGENVDDLFQIGCVGLIKAIDNFDLSQNVRFSTYAVPMIIGEIRRYLRDNNPIRVSRSLTCKALYAISFKRGLKFMIINKVEICGVNTSELPVFKADQMRELLVKIKQGDEDARQKFVKGNLRLVLSVIQKFNNRGERWYFSIFNI